MPSGGLRAIRHSGPGRSNSSTGCCRRPRVMTAREASARETFAEVRRHFEAAPERVFAAFADAGLVGRWLSPSPEITLTVLAFDFRVGGTYRFAYHVPGGSTVIVGGVYRVI